MASVNLALFWHHHQPFYKDLFGGEYLMPWVRLHGTKDYYGMARLLSRAGGDVRASINLVPSLVEQLEDYVAGGVRDIHLELSTRPADDLSEEERVRALDMFFMANWDRMIRRSPRYGELLAKRRPGRFAAQHMATEFTDAEIRDLQVWANLTWFHNTLLREDDELRELVAKDRGFTEAEKRGMLRRQREVLAEVIPLHRELADAKIVEITTTPYYHPILPLLAKMESAHVAMPGTPLPARRRPLVEDAREQLVRAVKKHEALFGEQPRGLWPSEGSVSPEILPLVREAGFSWLASDQEVLAASIDPYSEGDLYRPYRLETPAGDLAMVFRDHRLSDLVGFDYQRMPAEKAARDLVARVREAGRSHGDGALVTLVLDGENPWEYYPDGGVPFLTALYRELGGAADIRTVRIGEHLRANPPERKITRLHSGSWIHHDFAVWIGHEEDVRAWEYLFRVREDLARTTKERGFSPGDDMPDDLEKAWRSLYIAEGSDWTWWYGDDRTSGQDDAFDSLFRTHLENVYRFLDATPPAFLSNPVANGSRTVATIEPQGFLDVRLNGRLTSYFEWLGAGRYEAAVGESQVSDGGAMSRGGDAVLEEVRFGFDGTQLFFMAGLVPGWREDLEARKGVFRLSVRFLEPEVRELAVVDLLAPKVETVLDGAGLPPGTWGAVDEIAEFACPFEVLGRRPGDEIAFTVELKQDGILVERLPGAEILRVVVPGRDFEASRWRV